MTQSDVDNANNLPYAHPPPASELCGSIPQAHILIVDDSSFVLHTVGEVLRRAGHTVSEARTGADALALFTGQQIDLVLLDVILPDTDGFSLCQQIRLTSNVPIVMLTALNRTDDIVRGFELGADDYITKPFSLTEVNCRIAAILRRINWSGTKPTYSVLAVNDLTLDESAGQALIDERVISLSPIEIRLLRYLMERPDRPIHKDELFQQVWGYDLSGSTNLVEVAIRRLRAKIEKTPSAPKHIVTVHTIGYKFQSGGARRTATTNASKHN
jgi:two-component system, OmpR family, response regulator RpaB